MTNKQSQFDQGKALVTVFEDLQTAHQAIKALRDGGFSSEQIELVTYDVDEQAPEVTTPKVHETTNSSMVDSAEKWGTVGAGFGAIAGLVVPFPGSVLGMAAMGGVTGAIMGGMAGIEHAVEDDSVNLPSVEDYERLVNDGCKLVVVLCDHVQAKKAEDVIEGLPFIHNHTHIVEGHEFHEHPARRTHNK